MELQSHAQYHPSLGVPRSAGVGESTVSGWNWVLLAGIAGCLVFWGLVMTLVLAIANL